MRTAKTAATTKADRHMEQRSGRKTDTHQRTTTLCSCGAGRFQEGKLLSPDACRSDGDRGQRLPMH